MSDAVHGCVCMCLCVQGLCDGRGMSGVAFLKASCGLVCLNSCVCVCDRVSVRLYMCQLHTKACEAVCLDACVICDVRDFSLSFPRSLLWLAEC